MPNMPHDEAGGEAGGSKLEKAIADYHRRIDNGEDVSREDFLRDHESCASGLRDYFEMMDLVEQLAITEHFEQPNFLSDRLGGPDDQTARDSLQQRLPFRFGRYNVLKQLGRGGMGVVLLAYDTHLEREVALKFARTDRQTTLDWNERFIQEARTTIFHPNVCTIYDAGIQHGQAYISMAYINGKSLAEILESNKLLPTQLAATLIRTVARAMDAAHQVGIIHRDLKPSNIMIDVDGTPYVTDFGLSVRLGTLAQQGASLREAAGTLAYMAPEQFDNPDSKLGSSTDIYSLGVTFYQLLTGQLPFTGDRVEVIRQIESHRPTQPSSLRPDLAPELESICLRMMAKRPVDRFESMCAVADQLDHWLLTQLASSATETELAELGNRVRALSIGGAAAVAGLGLFEVVELLDTQHRSAEPGSEDSFPEPESVSDSEHVADRHEFSGRHDVQSERVKEANPQFGTPHHDQTFWDGQQNYADTCAIRCQEFILQQFTGKDFPEDALVNEAKEHGWYSPGAGTPADSVGKLLELHGVAVNRYNDANVFHLANELAQGHKVIIGVDSERLWESNSFLNRMLENVRHHFGFARGADHAVVVSGVDTSDPHHVKVTISDPGDGQAVATYPLEQFVQAWEGSHFFMVATQEPAPAHLPEMSHFDYAEGHVEAVGDLSYEDFLQRYAHDTNAFDLHPEEVDQHHPSDVTEPHHAEELSDHGPLDHGLLEHGLLEHDALGHESSIHDDHQHDQVHHHDWSDHDGSIHDPNHGDAHLDHHLDREHQDEYHFHDEESNPLSDHDEEDDAHHSW